jgi:DNA-directed RNA polymerase subunit RPC12/RpoP
MTKREGTAFTKMINGLSPEDRAAYMATINMQFMRYTCAGCGEERTAIVECDQRGAAVLCGGCRHWNSLERDLGQ